MTEPLPDNNAMRCCICTSLFCVVKIEFLVPCVDVEIEKEGYSFGKRHFWSTETSEASEQNLHFAGTDYKQNEDC